VPARASSLPDPSAHDESPPDPVAIVWADPDGRPMRLVWAGARWRVTDRPTVITEPVSWWPSLDPDARVSVIAFIAFSAEGRARFQPLFDQFVGVFAARRDVAELVRDATDFDAFIARLAQLLERG